MGRGGTHVDADACTRLPRHPKRLLTMLRSTSLAGDRQRHIATPALAADLVATTTAMREALSRLRRFALTDEPVIILGESGTGKTRLAEQVHRLSRRSSGHFHSLNLGRLDDPLAASDLFGHMKGSFTDARERRDGAFAAANGGSLFLDEMTKALPSIQAKLLDVMETHSFTPVGADRKIVVDVRLIFAANEDPEALVSGGRMLADFVARLGHFRIELPPLRKRRSDIPVLLANSVALEAPRFGYRDRPPPTISSTLEAALVAYRWPGNLRELDDLVRRLLTDAEGARELDVGLLVGDLERYRGTASPTRLPRGARATALADELRVCEGNKSEAARRLGISRATVNREWAAMTKGADGAPAREPPDGGEMGVSHSGE